MNFYSIYIKHRMADGEQKKVEDAEWDVIVVGAGLAGLSSAYRIKSRCPKAKILILEANDRIGGRTLSTEVSTQATSSSSGVSDVLDLGAHWICTTQHEIMNMAHEFGIKYFRQGKITKDIFFTHSFVYILRYHIAKSDRISIKINQYMS